MPTDNVVKCQTDAQPENKDFLASAQVPVLLITSHEACQHRHDHGSVALTEHRCPHRNCHSGSSQWRLVISARRVSLCMICYVTQLSVIVTCDVIQKSSVTSQSNGDCGSPSSRPSVSRDESRDGIVVHPSFSAHGCGCCCRQPASWPSSIAGPGDGVSRARRCAAASPPALSVDADPESKLLQSDDHQSGGRSPMP